MRTTQDVHIAASAIGSDRRLHNCVVVMHTCATVAASFGMLEFSWPFYTSIALCFLMFFQDRTIFFVYPGLLLMILGFLSPLILAGVPVAQKIPPNGPEYDHGMILGIFWFIAIFSFYVPAANKVQMESLNNVRIGRTDAVPYLAAIVLLFFSALMLQDGTLFDGGYQQITETRQGFIVFAPVITLIGFCSARSRLARHILLACAIVYLASAFLVGLRLRFISVSTVVFCCVVGINIKHKWKLVGLVGAFSLFLLGRLRNSGFGSVNLSQALSLEDMYRSGALISTPGGAFQTSKFHAYYAEYIAPHNSISGIYYFVGDVLSIFLTRSGVPQSWEIKSQTTAYFDVPGGGLLPGFFFAYFGLAGVIVLSVLVTALFVYILRRGGRDAFPYKVLLAAYAPRMLLYDWTVAFKMMFSFFILKAILLLIASALQNAPSYANSR